MSGAGGRLGKEQTNLRYIAKEEEGIYPLEKKKLGLGIERKEASLALISIHYDNHVNLNQFRLREVDSTIIITDDQSSNS